MSQNALIRFMQYFRISLPIIGSAFVLSVAPALAGEIKCDSLSVGSISRLECEQNAARVKTPPTPEAALAKAMPIPSAQPAGATTNASPAGSTTIFLRDGGQILADRVWVKDDRVTYERRGIHGQVALSKVDRLVDPALETEIAICLGATKVAGAQLDANSKTARTVRGWYAGSPAAQAAITEIETSRRDDIVRQYGLDCADAFRHFTEMKAMLRPSAADSEQK